MNEFDIEIEKISKKLVEQEEIIDKQNKELEALREFNKELFKFTQVGISGRALWNYYVDYRLIDEKGTPALLLTGHNSETNKEVTELEALREAAQDFIDKVDRKEARSVRSYKKFKDALAIGKENDTL